MCKKLSIVIFSNTYEYSFIQIFSFRMITFLKLLLWAPLYLPCVKQGLNFNIHELTLIKPSIVFIQLW